MPGSVDAFILDRDLAMRLDDEERKAEDEPVSDADAIEQAPVYDEANLPDPFATPPDEMGRH